MRGSRRFLERHETPESTPRPLGHRRSGACREHVCRASRPRSWRTRGGGSTERDALPVRKRPDLVIVDEASTETGEASIQERYPGALILRLRNGAEHDVEFDVEGDAVADVYVSRRCLDDIAPVVVALAAVSAAITAP
jgi:hypothetical protein